MPAVSALTETYLKVLDQAVAAGRKRPTTRDWYYFQLQHLLRAVDPSGRPVFGREAAELIPEDLAGAPYTNHFCRAVRTLFHWAQEAGQVPTFRFGAFQGPPCGQRERVLTEEEFKRIMETARLDLASRRRGRPSALRRVLWFIRNTFARPGEIRQLRWFEVHLDKHVIRLTRFKCRDKRRDGMRTRSIPLIPAAERLLRYWKQVRQPAPEDLVFPGNRRPWTGNSLRLAMSKVTKAAGVNLQPGERVVCYTLRHTGATEATRNGVSDRRLADILGHTTTRTTARYQHLNESDLVDTMAIATKRRKRQSVGSP